MHMGISAPALRLLEGGDEHPLRTGWCRRPGCAEPAVDLGFCGGCLTRYHRERDASEAVLARRAAATRRKLLRGAGPEAHPEWASALSEHLAAEGIDPDSPRGESALYEAVLSALTDFTRPDDLERAGLRLVR
jgi:hypothetical protein